MQYSSTSQTPAHNTAECLVIPFDANGNLMVDTGEWPAETVNAIQEILQQEKDGDDDAPASLLLHRLPGVTARVVLVRIKSDALNDRAWRKVINAALGQLKKTRAASATFYLTLADVKNRNLGWKIGQIIRELEKSRYQFNQLKSKKGSDLPPLSLVHFYIPARDDAKLTDKAIIQAQAIAAGVAFAKDLANLPGNICTPSYLADQAKTLAKETGINTHILEEADMQELGMGALLSVSRGSRQPAKLIVMEYHGGKEGDAPIALVGKGLTFDAGGISIKPAANMDEMKYDMCGGASVFGTLKSIAQMKLPINVVGVVPSSENLPDGDANKPGDIVTSMSGQTIEVLNTDAEGRLILCDALTYTAKFKPRAVIDIATLTGACIVALGHHTSGVMGNDQAVVDALLSAGDESGDRCWQLPLVDEYDEQLKSPFADMANIGGRGAGTITAGCFLGRYTKDYHWAHLDIAGTAWVSGHNKGATGRPVPLLTQYLIDQAGEA